MGDTNKSLTEGISKVGNLKTETEEKAIAKNPDNLNITEKEAKEKYDKVYLVTVTLEPEDDTEVELSYIFKKPKTASYDRYLKKASQSMLSASKTFVLDNVIYEHNDKLLNDLEEYPILPLSIVDKLLYLLGFGKDTNLTKL